MKTFFSSVICCLLLAFYVHGQTQIDSNEYGKAQSLSLKSESLSRREEIRLEVYENGKVVEVVTESLEVVPPDKFHSVERTESNGKTITVEIIIIGDKRYIKNANGKWKTEDSETDAGSFRLGSADSRLFNRKYTVQDVNYNGKKAKLYEKTVIFTGDSKTPAYYNDEKFWLDENGLLLKSEDRNGLNEQTIKTLYVKTFAYDSSIKIKAPRIETRKRK